MDLFTYLMAKNGNNSSVHGDLFSYLLGKGQSQTQTISGVTIYIPDAKAKRIVSLIMTKESTQATSILPSEYTQVDYIESSGTQEINTNFKPNNNSKITVDIAKTTTNVNAEFIFGVRNSERTSSFSGFTWGSNQLYSGYGNSGNVNSNFTFELDTRYNITLDKNLLYVNDELETTHSTATFTNDEPLYLFAYNAAGNIEQRGKYKLYYCKIWDNDTLVRDFIPCYRNSDSEVGLYDLVNDVFYTNQGSGQFTYGSVAQLPNPDYQIEVNTVKGYRNLFDKDNVTWYQAYITTGSEWMTAKDNSRTLRIPVESNTTYIISVNNPNETIFRAGYTISENTPSTDNPIMLYEVVRYSNTNTPIIITTGDSAKYIVLQLGFSQSKTSIQTLQTIEGTEEKPYVPYGNNYVDVKVQGKNLFKEIFRQGSRFSTTATDRLFSDDNYYIEEGKTYTFSTNLNTSNYKYAINISASPFPVTSSTNLLYDSGWIRQETFTFTASVSGYLGVPIAKVDNSAITLNDINNVTWQLEKGSVATSHETYIEPNNIPIPLNNNEIVGIGNYKDELKVDKSGRVWINKIINKLEFQGNENWYYLSSSNAPIKLQLSNAGKLSESSNVLPNLFCNSYKKVRYNDSWISYNSLITARDIDKIISIRDINFNNITDFKNMLSNLYNNNNPVNLYYPLATPDLIDLNTTVDIKLFKGANTITNSEDANMTIEYY